MTLGGNSGVFGRNMFDKEQYKGLVGVVLDEGIGGIGVDMGVVDVIGSERSLVDGYGCSGS